MSVLDSEYALPPLGGTIDMTAMTTTALSARRLAEAVATGELAMPEFQRDFVWEPRRVVDFLDTVANAWMPGTILLLESQPGGRLPDFAIRGFDQGPTFEKRRPRYLVLDGQQRLTALYHGLYNRSPTTVYYASTPSFPGDTGIRSATRRQWETIQSRDPSAVLVSEVAGLAPHTSGRQLRLQFDTSWLAEARSRLRGLTQDDGHIPAVILGADLELSALVKIFETTNASGVKLNAFDLMVAALYPSGFNLRNRWADALEKRPLLYRFGVDGVDVLRLISLWHTTDQESHAARGGIRQSDILKLPRPYIEQKWDGAVEQLDDAYWIASTKWGMIDSALVPARSMMLTATALRKHLSDAEVESWFWASCISQKHAQGSNTQAVQDYAAMIAGAYVVPDARINNEIDEVMRSPVARNSIASAGLACALVRCGAQDPATGRKLLDFEGGRVELEFRSISEIASPSDLGRMRFIPRVGELVLMPRGALRRVRSGIIQREESVLSALETQCIPALSGDLDDLATRTVSARAAFYSQLLNRMPR